MIFCYNIVINKKHKGYSMRLPRSVFMTSVSLGYWFTSKKSLTALSLLGIRLFAKIVLLLNGKTERKTELKDIALEWQRMFPKEEMPVIKKIENDTVYAEIHTPCPHRGTGNVYACHRMMEFDRAMLEKIGGEFVILKSQAEKDVKVCEVAIRKQGATLKGLTHTHDRYPQEIDV